MRRWLCDSRRTGHKTMVEEIFCKMRNLVSRRAIMAMKTDIWRQALKNLVEI